MLDDASAHDGKSIEKYNAFSGESRHSVLVCRINY